MPPVPLLSGFGGTCGGERSAAPPADCIATGDGLATVVVVGEGETAPVSAVWFCGRAGLDSISLMLINEIIKNTKKTAIK